MGVFNICDEINAGKLKRMDLFAWQTASMDVKQSIISQGDPQTVRRLCQSNRQSRELCRDRLPAEIKFRSCLDSKEAAQECDRIPMFSRQQFLRLIPPQIEIFADEPLQLRHDFYSQNYKLKTEGFSEALRKAKIINTLVALSRPNVLLKDADQLPALPAYIDADKLDQLLSFYKESADRYKADLGEDRFAITITAQNSLTTKVKAIIHLWVYWSRPSVAFALTVETDVYNRERLRLLNDPFILRYFRAVKYPPIGRSANSIVYKNLDNTNDAPNAFIFSRIIYDLLNKGFDIWTVEYSYGLNRSSVMEI